MERQRTPLDSDHRDTGEREMVSGAIWRVYKEMDRKLPCTNKGSARGSETGFPSIAVCRRCVILSECDTLRNLSACKEFEVAEIGLIIFHFIKKKEKEIRKKTGVYLYFAPIPTLCIKL